jgi:YD repeat-containing protein
MKILILLIVILFAFNQHLVAQQPRDENEIVAELENMLPEERLNRARNWFQETDTDGDGRISLEEFPEKYMRLWPIANTNNDNYLTLAEELMYQRIEHEEKVMKEMSKVSRLSEIQHTLDNDVLPKQNQMQDVTGEWICFTTMSSKGNPGNGIMYIGLTQNDTKLEGDLQQIKNPHNEEIIYKYDEKGQIKGRYAAALKGEIFVAPGEKVRHNMIILHRKDLEGNFRAIFTGSVSADGNSIIAQLTNNMGHYGTMLMMRRELLMQY